jgi:S1-C subfamily serine protease
MSRLWLNPRHPTMNKLLGWGGLGTLVAGLLTFGIIWNTSAKIPHGFYQPSAFVKLEASNGSGSGVHIGDGFIVTAAHVVSQSKTMLIKGDDGRVIDREGVVLWTNTAYDIALIRVDHPRLKSAHLSCAPNFTGQGVRAYGSPMDVDFVYTSGTVVGAARANGPWASVLRVDGTLVYGQSGGGVVDDNGNVVGITVGLMPTQYGIAAFGFVVPARAVCDLLARA